MKSYPTQTPVRDFIAIAFIFIFMVAAIALGIFKAYYKWTMFKAALKLLSQ